MTQSNEKGDGLLVVAFVFLCLTISVVSLIVTRASYHNALARQAEIKASMGIVN